ncbi:DUF1254 domain-containing protein [Mesorhizobium sp. STM 4661]|uniref:DUF1254 domain-containing protein n=1 Tax=Mesorhizobium sp. STM 4661 TaxID=1297570 RepID=UPI001FCB0E7F|nr:DUF1254 domain-containing protein [Mesorhizobium sp. STM 4661]
MAYDNLDLGRGVETFLSGIPATSVYALCEGFKEAGYKPNEGIGITENLADARALFLTPNSTVVYVWFCADLKEGPMVVEVPPGALGMIDDAYFRYVTDLGVVGPDQGKGGKYLLVPPGDTGSVPSEGYFVQKPRTYSNLFIIRAFVKDGDVAGAVASIKANARMYPLSVAANPPAQKFVNISGVKFNTVHANDFHFYEELNAVVQHEPADFLDPETAGLFAAIGIKKDKPFAPDARMKAILTDAVAVGNATARAILFSPRDPRLRIFPDRQWFTTFIGGSHEFIDGGARLLDARAMFHYYATGVTPAMTAAKPGTGSTYAIAARDSQGRYFDGGKIYKVTMPAPVPAARFWSFTIYDNQTRSMLETDQATAGLDSTYPALKADADGSVTVWFSPQPPAGHEGNWVQTMPGKGWNTLLRLYGPLEPWFDKTWKPSDFELVE